MSAAIQFLADFRSLCSSFRKKTIENTDMILGAELDNIVKLLKATDAELVKDRSNE